MADWVPVQHTECYGSWVMNCCDNGEHSTLITLSPEDKVNLHISSLQKLSTLMLKFESILEPSNHWCHWNYLYIQSIHNMERKLKR